MRSTGWIVKAVAFAAAFTLMEPALAMDYENDGLEDDIPYLFVTGMTADSLARAEACGWPGGDDVARRMAGLLKAEMELTPQGEATLLRKAGKDGKVYSSYEDLFVKAVQGFRQKPTMSENQCDRADFDTYNQAVGWEPEPVEAEPDDSPTEDQSGSLRQLILDDLNRPAE